MGWGGRVKQENRQRHVHEKTSRISHVLPDDSVFYEPLSALMIENILTVCVCACGHSLKAPSDPHLCVAGQALIIIHTGAPAAGKGKMLLSLCVYISAASFFYDIRREAFLCTPGHTGLIKVH